MSYDVQGHIGAMGGTLHVSLSPVRIAILDSTAYAGGLYLNRVNVPKDYRGRGIGSALLEAFKESSRRAGHRHVVVEPGGYADADQERRVRWYEKHGFVRQKEGFYLLDLSKEG